MSISHPSSRARGGFTLIELLVVMGIIATLAGLGMVGIPRIMRKADQTASKARLGELFRAMHDYQGKHDALPGASGPEFVMAVFHSGDIEHTAKDCEVFFCASSGVKPDKDLGNVNADFISWTGPDQRESKRRMRIQDRNANDKVMICNRLPAAISDEKQLDELPHSAKGICYLTLGGATEWIDASAFGGEEHLILGPDCPIEKFKSMMPDEN